MIKSDFGKVAIKGNTPLLMAELESVVEIFLEKEILTKEQLEEVFEKALNPKEDFEDETMTTKELQELMMSLIEARKSGLIEDETDLEEPQIETIVNNENMKISKISFNGKGKSKDEILEEANEAIKKLIEGTFNNNEDE